MAWKDTSHWWWFGSRESSRQSPWLEATLDELDDKTKGMLKLIEGDADSFGQRVEMYYEKRPQLIAMVEEFYRDYRSLAERYDLIKSDPGTRLVAALGSPFVSSTKCQSENFHAVDPHSDNYSESLDSDNYAMSEVADPEHENQIHGDGEIVDPELHTENSEVKKLREDIEALKEENRAQRNEIFSANKTIGLLENELFGLREKVSVLENVDRHLETSNVEIASLREEIGGLIKENEVLRYQIVQTEINKGLTDELARLREEIGELGKENKVLRNQIVQAEKNQGQSDEYFDKMEDEICKMKRENRIHRERLCEAVALLKDPSVQKKEEKDVNEYFAILQVEIKKLKNENQMQNMELTQKDEEKREVIRQLSSAVGLLKDENVLLRNFIARESPTKKRNDNSPFEFCKRTAEISRKLFNCSPTSQASVAAL